MKVVIREKNKARAVTPYDIRRIILEQSKRANVGHIGSALSIADMMAALYGNVLRITRPEDPKRDRFILSKGHAALALYAAFFLKGWLTQKDLNSYCADNSRLGVHPEHFLKGVDFSTGSLGQGLSMGTGAALAASIRKDSYRTFVLISDAECNEGSVWEAAMFAAQHKLSNLIVLIDYNRQQAFGYTKDVLNLDPLDKRWEAFGWNVRQVDGHDVSQITQTIRSLSAQKAAPSVIIANTVFGKGVSYMENRIKWHYWPMSDGEYTLALQEIESLK